MRIDRLLCYLRFVRTRGAARRLVAKGQIRRNGERVTRASQSILPGDVLTLPLGERIGLVEIRDLPVRRGPPREAAALYRELDPHGQTDLAAPQRPTTRGKTQP